MQQPRRIARYLGLVMAVAAPAAFAQTPTPAPAPAQPAAAKRTSAPEDARVYFISPSNGARIRGQVLVRFGLRNMGVTRAGDNAPNVGHHHLLINVNEFDATQPLPTDRSHLHFGGGQTETRVDLPIGRHTLQLVLGDFEHRPFDPIVASEKITVYVVPPERRKRRIRGRR